MIWNNFHYLNFLSNFTDFEVNLKLPFNFELQKNWPLRDIVSTTAQTPLYQIGQGVFQTELKVLLINLVDMHTPSPKIEEDIEFLKVLNVKQFMEKILVMALGTN
jgi:hypothetical protein